MHGYVQRPIAILGVTCIAFAVWQWGVNIKEATTETNAEEGHISWLLPGSIGHLGPPVAYQAPRTTVIFQTKVTYPETIYTGHGFQILLESKVSAVRRPNDSERQQTEATRVTEILQDAFHSFELELPGLEFSPTGTNRLGVDGKVRWQVAPPREPGVYRGYVRPKAGTADVLGADYKITWKNPGDFELEIPVIRSFKYVDNFESLVLGFLGSVLSFPAMLTIYKSLRSP